MKSSRAWPTAGMMRNGKLYKRIGGDCHTIVEGSLLLPTPRAFDATQFQNHCRPSEVWPTARNLTARLIGYQYQLSDKMPKPPGWFVANPLFLEEMMGYPHNYTNII